MKFPRNARIFRGHFDAAPFAAVFFLLILFIQLGSLTYTPGVHIQLPVADGFVGTEKPTVAVAMDPSGRFYFDNHSIAENDLKLQLHKKIAQAREPLALVVQADKDVTKEMLDRITLIAQQAGFSEAVLATLPSSLSPAEQKRSK
jgi:biopolymer transport protein ExbD